MMWETAFAWTHAKCIAASRGAMGPARTSSLHVGVMLFCTVTASLLAQTSGTWQAQDIGTVAAAGHSSVSGSTFTVSGSGSDIWGGSDAFHFHAQTVAGDGSITVRITGMTDTNGWAKAGVMIRDSLAANAPNVFLAATPEWHGITAQQRAATGDNTGNVAGHAVIPPYWLRLTRTGTTVIAATSPDGTTWSTVTS